jgi:uncharacterized protein YlxW (UPF0749 family)
VAAVAGLAGLLFVTCSHAFRDSGGQVSDLAGLVSQANKQVAQLEDANKQLSGEVDALTEKVAGGGATPKTDTDLSVQAGRETVQGPGVTITLNDSPDAPTAQADTGSDSLPLDLYVVHQQDIESVLNTLWAAGAEAVAVQGQRITSVAAIRCVGSVLYVAGRTYSPPYKIEAIGDAAKLAKAAQTSSLTAGYRRDAAELGLGWSVKTSDQISIDGYSGGSITLRYVANANGQ